MAPEIEISVVTKTWVAAMPWKKQSAFFSALRGPDTAFSPNIKLVTKFLRMVSQYDADSTSDYMNVKREINWKELERELELSTLHFVAHLLEAISLVREYCPEVLVSREALELIGWFQETFHFAYSNQSG